MKQKLIIVESPSKSKTINSYLGNDYLVLSSKGHIRDLSTKGEGGLGLDIANDFNPQYEIIKGKSSIVKELTKEAKNREVYLATDPDREGEAIAWHLAEVLKLDLSKANRIVFREITKPAVLEALNQPRPIDRDLVNSQEARRILDRIIGFKLSGLLQRKIKSKSAGRVQSVALKLIVDLEKEIQAFVPETYYELTAKFDKFDADYVIKGKKKLTKEEADLIKLESKNPFIIESIETKESIRKPKPAFITSTLQQDGVTYLNMSSSKVMSIAQKLYEGIEINGEIVGLITYMRTDSTRISPIFANQTTKYIEDNFGKNYLGKYIAKKTEMSQDAHEAIRPTDIQRRPEDLQAYLSKDEYRLYKRIYERTLASFMANQIFDKTIILLNAGGHVYKTEGIKLRFDGFAKVYDDNKTKDKKLPEIQLNDKLNAQEIIIHEKVTQPKARYNEATLIKEMETLGIGRPSTYASIISTIKDRDYVVYEDKRLVPTPQGILTSEQLDLFFSKIINVEYTSKMEKALDEIASGKSGVELVSKFYYGFMPMIERANKEMEKIQPEQVGELCPVCGKPLVIRQSKYGAFIGCSGFPSCKYIKKDEK